MFTLAPGQMFITMKRTKLLKQYAVWELRKGIQQYVTDIFVVMLIVIIYCYFSDLPYLW
jgi:hypothetical protein